jgi:exodeoxyribonuclease VII large subunit
MAKEYLRVSELNRLIQDVIHAGFPQPLWVCGEVQGYDRNRGKTHIFFELVEKAPDSDSIVAKIGLVLFGGRKPYIDDILQKSENAFSLKDDIEVKFACSIDFYPPHGAVRLVVESIDPTYTLGKLAQEKQRLVALLKARGTLDKNKQTELSVVPLRIGLITADDSAAYNDFVSELAGSGFGYRIYLRNALMQGRGAEKDICAAIGELGRLDGLDAVVVTRGGGSIADLSCFDSRVIAEKISECPLPVLSGIGHEINVSVTDLAAHTFAKTPTAIARFLVNRVQVFLEALEEKRRRIIEGAREKIAGEKRRLKDDAVNLQNGTRAFVKDHHERLIRVRETVRQRPPVLLKGYRRALDHAQEVLRKASETCLAGHRGKVDHYQKLVDMVHPANTLKRGFSITRTKDGKVLKSVGAVSLKAELMTELADGVVTSVVGDVRKTMPENFK